MKRKEVFEFYRRLAELNPDPQSELEWVNPYTLLVAVTLSAQATDVSVNLATRRLFGRATTALEMLALGEDDLREIIKTIGLFNTKAANVMKAARRLQDEYAGEVPQTLEELESLPGVGRKTANVVLNMAFGQPRIAVDTHVHRVANRTGLATTTTPEQTERVLLARVPERHLLHAHHYLILHGRYTCIARRPECWRCPLVKLCRYRPKTTKPENAGG